MLHELLLFPDTIGCMLFLSYSCHGTKLDRITVNFMLTQHKLTTCVSMERNAKRRQMAAFVEMTQRSYLIHISF